MKTRVEGALAGAGLGTFVGILIGLSGSPVVAAAIGSAFGVLTAVMGWTSQKADQQKSDSLTGRSLTAAVIAFGFTATCGTLTGIYLRANGILSPTPEARVALWKDAHYPDGMARALTAFELTGVVSEGFVVAEKPSTAGTSTVLYAGRREFCDKVDPRELPDADSWRLALKDLDSAWDDLGGVVSAMDDKDQVSVLSAAWRLVCGN